MKPLLVGEANPYQSDPRLAQRYALYPDPPRCAGWNLCHRVMQLDEDEYLRRFDRVNLCDRKWGMKEARARAASIVLERREAIVERPSSAVILFGSKVCKAFGVPFLPFMVSATLLTTTGPTMGYVILPHPSGLSRAWNVAGAHERARAVLKEAGVL